MFKEIADAKIVGLKSVNLFSLELGRVRIVFETEAQFKSFTNACQWLHA